MHSGWYSSLFPSATLLRRSLSGHRSAPKPVVAGALRYTAQPASQCLHRSSVSRIGECSCAWGSKLQNNLSLGSVRRTGAIVAKRRSVRFTCSTSKENQESDTQFTDRNNVTVYQRTVTRSIHIKAPVPYIQVGISRTQDHWSFHHGTLQRPGHSLGRYTCPVTTMPQQSYPIPNLAAEPSPEAAHW